MFNNLIFGDSRAFYKHKLNTFTNSIKKPNQKDLDNFSRTIKRMNRFCVCLGVSELLAPFGLYLSDKLKKHKKNNYDAIKETIKDVGFAISSMKEHR